MALPQDGQNANGLTKVTQIPAGKELMFIDPTTNEGGIITLEDLTKQILNGLLSQTFALDAGQKTIIQALNTLNSDKVPKKVLNLSDEASASTILNSVNAGDGCNLLPVWGTIGGLYSGWAWGIVLAGQNNINFIGVENASKKLAAAQYSNGKWVKIL